MLGRVFGITNAQQRAMPIVDGSQRLLLRLKHYCAVSDNIGSEQSPRRSATVYSTVTDFARFRGLSTSVPRAHAAW